jgi:cell division protein FtsL
MMTKMIVVVVIMTMTVSVQFFIIYVPSQQLQGQLQTQHTVDTGNYIKDKQKHKDNSHI